MAKKSKQKVHIATTNYDDLFYRFLLDEGYMLPNKNDTFFTDGFNRGGTTRALSFDPSGSPAASWYMHLHGSSRYYSFFHSDKVRKFPSEYDRRQEILFPEGDNNILEFVPQIILSYYDFKNFQIISNSFLEKQFTMFKEILPTIKILYIIGYSGNDVHINDSINKHLREGASIKIIVHNGKTNNASETSIWQSKYPSFGVAVEQCDNVLDYRFE